MARQDDLEEVDSAPLFFGDRKRQAEITDTLSTALKAKKGGLYLVIGGERTGKGSALAKVEAGFARDRSFVPLSSAKPYFNAGSMNELKAAITVSSFHTHGNFGGESLRVYESNSPAPHTVLFIEEGFVFPKDENKVRKLLDAHRKLDSKEPLSIVMDFHNRHGLLMPGVQTAEKKKTALEVQKTLKSLAKDYPELQVLETRYDQAQTREQLWQLRKTYSVKQVKNYLEQMNVKVTHPAIIGVCKALEEKTARNTMSLLTAFLLAK